jgi:hypothetical protein
LGVRGGDKELPTVKLASDLLPSIHFKALGSGKAIEPHQQSLQRRAVAAFLPRQM